ncbi:MAG: dTDP-4-dehydrorhamnose reductase [Melioribacteraceae bacterium]|nr:dTDP-4-dehydrorhamnose reductase [Melioribacteraceae bacterium]
MIKKRVCIVGSNGMLGQKLVDYYSKSNNTELLCCSAEESSWIDNVDYMQVDITSKKSVQNSIKKFYPDFIINTAAFTNVDGCESEKELSWKVNVSGVENLIKAGNSCDSHIIHLSTDYVFDGKEGPYDETAKPNPISSYGRSKLASENLLRSKYRKATIVRTNVLYGHTKYGRPDFVNWIIDSLKQGKEIRIVTDQINNPTLINDLVQGISKIIEFGKYGIYNIGGNEFLSRYDFAIRIAEFFDLNESLIREIETKELNQPAARPLKSGLIILKAQTQLGYKPHKIEEALSIIKTEMEKNV